MQLVDHKNLNLDVPAFHDRIPTMEKQRYENAIASRESYRAEQSVAQEPPTREEYALLNQLHRSQEDQSFNGLLSSQLVADSWERMFPEQENVPTTIFGGYLVRRAYELSSICAELVAPNRPVVITSYSIHYTKLYEQINQIYIAYLGRHLQLLRDLIPYFFQLPPVDF